MLAVFTLAALLPAVQLAQFGRSQWQLDLCRDLPNGFSSSWCIDGQVANEESVATLSIAGDTCDVLALAKQCILAQPNGVTCGDDQSS